MYRLIACDLDGTLLTTRGDVSPATHQALLEAQRRGLGLVIATGRTYPMMRYFCQGLELNAPQITCNGAAIVDPTSGEPTQVTTVPSAFVAPVLRFLEHQQVPAALFGLETISIREDNPYAALLVPRELDPPVRVASLFDLVGSPCTKIVAMDPPEVIARLRPLAEDQFGMDLYVTQTSTHLLEFHHPDVSKGKGLAAIARTLGIRPEEIVAFGDSHNDLDLVQFAGLGVAMGNASAELRAAADLVAPSNDDDGIAWVLRHHILPES